MTYKIITAPDPVLKTAATPAASVDDALRAQMDKMLATMYEANGIGLAANQVNLLNRVLVMDVERREGGDDRKPVFMVNPDIVWTSEEKDVMEEGCLSLPGLYADVERPSSVRIKYLDYNGAPQEILAERMLARCAQHEIDHLNGVLFIDYLSSLKRNMMLRKAEKMKKEEML